MREALYIAEDGEIKLFEAVSRYVVTPPLPGDVLWSECYRPDLDEGERLWGRIEPLTVRLEKGIRRLLEERDQLREALEKTEKVADLYLDQR